MKTLLKDNLLEIKNTFKRFMSILLIVLLGVGFFAGIKATSPDMKLTLDTYFDDKNFMDFTVISTFGINDDDINALEEAEGVKEVIPAYSKDAVVTVVDENVVVKLHSITKQINQLEVIDGGLPTNINECVVEENFMTSTQYKIGDKITVSPEVVDDEENEFLKENELTIVGVVESPMYISMSRGSTKLGSGSIDYFIYIDEQNINQEIYTEAYITLYGAKELKSYSDQYKRLLDSVEQNLKDISEVRKLERYDEILTEANDKLLEAEDELQQAKEKAQKEIDDAEKKISDAKTLIKNSEIEIYNNQVKAENEFKLAEEKIESSEKELKQNEDNFEPIKEQILLGISQVEQSIEDLRLALEVPGANIDEIKAQITQLEAQIQEGRNTIENTQRQFDIARDEIEKAKKLLEENKNSTYNQLNSAKSKINNSKKELLENEVILDDKKREAQQEFEKAEVEINDARKEIEDIKEPIWYILDRDTNAGYMGFMQDSDRIANIGKVFPIVFFVVAALISLTSMTRMVEEERGEIGILKALRI